MSNEPTPTPDLPPLRELAELREQPFRSDVPVLGGLIAWFRSAWNSVSTKWYLRPIMAQQSAYNQAVLDYLEQIDARCRAIDLLAADLDRRLVAQDREKTHLVHELGEATARIVQLRAAIRVEEEEGPTSAGDRPA
jgi:hypothetical protein